MKDMRLAGFGREWLDFAEHNMPDMLASYHEYGLAKLFEDFDL